MRFFFANGGWTGCLSVSSLADYMETFPTHRLDEDGDDVIAVWASGELRVDFSPGKNGRGQPFRGELDLECEIAAACEITGAGHLVRKGVRDLAASYWAEGEAIELARAAPSGRPGRGKPSL